MLIKFSLFVFFIVGCSQVLCTDNVVKIGNDDNDPEPITGTPDGFNSSESQDVDDIQAELMKSVYECCLNSGNNVTKLVKVVAELEQVNNESAKNISELMKSVSEFEEIKKNYEEKINELTETVLNLKMDKNELQQEIANFNQWENDLRKFDEDLRREQLEFGKFRKRLDEERERLYQQRLSLEKTGREMRKQFNELQDQKSQVSQCMNDVTFAESDDDRENAQETYHLTTEEERNILYKCRSITDVGRKYLYKCLPPLNVPEIPDQNTSG